jgi:hypothetical protein
MADDNKVMEELLRDWALKSDDGLVGGYNTPSNIKALESVLIERGFPKNQATKMAKSLSDTLQTSINKKSNGKNEGAASKFSMRSLVDDKDFPPDIAKAIFNAVNSKRIITDEAIRQEFINEVYDKKESIEDAIAYWNANMSRYVRFFKELDEVIRPEKVGWGEYAMVLALRGCRTGGQQSGDLRMADGTVADVKKIETNGMFRTSEAVFGGGGFARIPFVSAINDLIAFCKKNPESKPLFKDLCEKAELPGDPNADRGPHAMTKQFFETLSWQKINNGTVKGLILISGYLHGMPKEELEKLGSGENVKFDLEDESVVLSVDDIKPEVKNKIIEPDLPPTTINVTVSAFNDTATQLLLPQIKRLELFRNSPSDTADSLLNVRYIAKSMFKSMEHYDAGVVFYQPNKEFTYEKDLINSKTPWAFYSYQQTGPVFVPLK